MSDDKKKTETKPPEFDFSAFPSDSVFHERRTGADRRDGPPRPAPVPAPQEPKAAGERRAKKERRKRIDPTTFEKQYTEDELEFMTAVQKFKERSGKPFPSYGEVLRVAVSLGYRRVVIDENYPIGLVPSVDSDSDEDAAGGFDEEMLASGAVPKSPHIQ